MTLQWKNFIFWVGAILIIVLATVLYQPEAAKTGSLLVWTRNRVYVMDIDSLNLQRVGPAEPNQSVTPSPGCFGQTKTPCWVLIDGTLYEIDLTLGSDHNLLGSLPAGEGFSGKGDEVSWSPDGRHVAYYVLDKQNDRVELRVYNAITNETKVIDSDVEPTVAVAWIPACTSGLGAADCELGYKKIPERIDGELLATLVGYVPASETFRQWTLSPEPIFELRWSPDGMLLYSRPKRHFISPEDHAEAYKIPAGAQLANMSPDTGQTVYYQPFTMADCQAQDGGNDCMHLGVWLTHPDETEEGPSLIYNMELSKVQQSEGLNFIPVWSPQGNTFVFFQQGQLIHYDLDKQEGTIWYKPVTGKLRSIPVFSPDGEAVAFVDSQGQGLSEYRLVVVNPRLEPVEEIIDTNQGFRILAWLPN